MTNRRPSQAQVRDMIRAAFEAKIHLLEMWAKGGLPDGAEYPKDHAKLRRWKGPDGSLPTWTDPTIDRAKTGKYPLLANRFDNAIKDIEERIARSKGNRRAKSEADLAVLRRQYEHLVVQNSELIGRIALLEQKLAQAEARLRGMGHGEAIS
jgi:hypothetical protein